MSSCTTRRSTRPGTAPSTRGSGLSSTSRRARRARRRRTSADSDPHREQGRPTTRGGPVAVRVNSSPVRDPRQARFLTWASLRWIVRHRAWTPWYLVRYWRFLKFRLRNPHVITEGFVFLGRNVELYARRGYGRLILG